MPGGCAPCSSAARPAPSRSRARPASCTVEGRAAGALAWLRVSAVLGEDQGLPTAPRFAAFLNARACPAWIAAADGSPVWVNAAWLKAVDAASLDEAAQRGVTFDRGADTIASEAANLGQRREAVRWLSLDGRRRAFHITAQPLDGGGVGVWTDDLTDLEEAREDSKRNVEAHDETLNRIDDAVVIFDGAKRLKFHNTAFAELWGLEPAWLAERPTHAEILDRLRQRRRLPETVDYAKWKAAELERYEHSDAAPDDMWSTPDGRTLRVVRQPHPLGGLLLLFSDITDDLKMKAQFSALVQVQQATLDKLSDAVAVFGSDGRLRLHNESFERFWNITPLQLEAGRRLRGRGRAVRAQAARHGLLEGAQGPGRRPRSRRPHADHRRGADLGRPHRWNIGPGPCRTARP